MPVFIDQTGRPVLLEKTARRIISLVPSQTELLYDLGLTDAVIGITRFCIHPEEWFHDKARVGGTRQLSIDRIHQLQPDLIIANKEENVKEQVEELATQYPVWISDVNNINSAYEMIRQIGSITGTINKAREIVADIQQSLSKLPAKRSELNTAYLIWQKPYMTVGGDTFINSMMEIAGFGNMYKDQQRYPEIAIDDLRRDSCQLLLLSSEPFPFKQKHIDEIQPLLPQTKILLVDGEMFSWYGSRLLVAAEYINKLQRSIL